MNFGRFPWKVQGSTLIQPGVSRRDFIKRAVGASSAVALCGSGAFSAARSSPPIVVFSKVYQALKLSFDDAAAVTAEAGLDGVDPPVRPGGEVLPEHVQDELPRYADALQKRNLYLPLLTTAITRVDSPN